MAATAMAATSWLQPFEECVYRVQTKSGGICLHKEASSAFDPGFRAIICLDAQPASLLSCLGLLPDLDLYRYLVFLQQTA